MKQWEKNLSAMGQLCLCTDTKQSLLMHTLVAAVPPALIPKRVDIAS